MVKIEVLKDLFRHAQLEQQLKAESEEWNKAKKEYEATLHDLRSKIIVFQHEREKEATNGVIMLR